MNESTGGVLNTTIVKKYVCKGCGGGLVEKFLDGSFTVVCASGCESGFCKKQKYDKARSKKLEDYMEAAANYPELLPQESNPQKRKTELASMF